MRNSRPLGREFDIRYVCEHVCVDDLTLHDVYRLLANEFGIARAARRGEILLIKNIHPSLMSNREPFAMYDEIITFVAPKQLA